MPIAINGSGTVTGISVGGLPDGIVDTDMIAAKAATAAKIGDGGIIQVVHALKTDTQSTTANLAHANAVEISGMSCTITLTNSSNKVLLLMSLMIGASQDTTIGGTIRRGTTIVAQADADNNRTRNTWGLGNGASARQWRMTPLHCTVIDTPGSGTHTYTAKYGGNGAATIYINREGRHTDNNSDTCIATSSLTVMEIVT